MSSSSESGSDQDPDLPSLDLILSGQCLAASGGPGPGGADQESDGGKAKADVMMISSDSDDDAPYVPLAQRLQQRQEGGTRTSSSSSPSAATDGGAADRLQKQPGSSLTSSSRRRANQRTAQEIQASKEEALRKRRAREEQQQEQERLKAERRAVVGAAKALRPEECVRHMVVSVDPALLQQEGGGALLAALQALGCSCAIEKQTLPRSVGWRRRSPSAQSGEEVSTPETTVVLSLTVDDFISLVHSYNQEENLGSSDCGPTLTSWMMDRQRTHPHKTLSLVVVELDKYFKLQKSVKEKKMRDAVAGEETGRGKARKRRRKSGGEEPPELTRVQVEQAVVHLQLHTGVPVHFLSTWQDFATHVAMVTKAVAEAPFKSEREKTGFSFHLDSEWAGGQRVEKNGRGLLQVWKRQIQQLNRVSPDMAAAIMAAYPSPRLLQKAYRLCSSDQEKSLLLSEVLIRRGEGVTSTSRRVGPELSKRLFLLINSTDPQQTLDAAV